MHVFTADSLKVAPSHHDPVPAPQATFVQFADGGEFVHELIFEIPLRNGTEAELRQYAEGRHGVIKHAVRREAAFPSSDVVGTKLLFRWDDRGRWKEGLLLNSG